MPLRATIPATEVIAIQAKNVKQEYRVSVALPYSYLSKPRKRYPVIYLIDANFYFGMVTELTRLMPLCGGVPETIVVGIGYPVDEPLDTAFNQIAALRSRDLTPVVDKELEEKDAKELKVERVRTGGARRFLQFIKSELIPAIEVEFRASSTDRILAGHSYGGLFVLYALFQQPNLFNGYVACSPSLWYRDRVTFKYESRFAKTHKTLPVKLYLGVGDLEEGTESHMVSNTIQFAARMKNRNYKGFSLTKQTVDNCGHCASPAPTFQAGLQAVLT
jgi:predicted alpha/beta superfamily hydrolase